MCFVALSARHATSIGPGRKGRARMPRKSKEVSPEMIERQIVAQTDKLIADNTLDRLREMYSQVTGVATRIRDKKKLARKIAVYLVTGDTEGKAQTQSAPQPENGEPLQAQPPVTVGPDVQAQETIQTQTDKVVRKILEQVKATWDELENATEEKKTAIAGLKQIINQSREKIATTIRDDSLSPEQKLTRMEGHWSVLVGTEAKATETRRAFNERIKSARQIMRHEMESTKQIPLFG